MPLALLQSGQCHNKHYEQRFTHKNSRWQQRKQRRATKIKGELRAILQLCWTTLKTNQCKKMRIYNTELKLARFIRIM